MKWVFLFLFILLVQKDVDFGIENEDQIDGFEICFVVGEMFQGFFFVRDERVVDQQLGRGIFLGFREDMGLSLGLKIFSGYI